MYCTAHRIFLAALLVATKFLQDPPIKNRQWASATHRSSSYQQLPSAEKSIQVNARKMFSLAELNLMERQFLFLIGFELSVTKDQAAEVLLDCIPANLVSSPSSSPSSSPTLLASDYPTVSRSAHPTTTANHQLAFSKAYVPASPISPEVSGTASSHPTSQPVPIPRTAAPAHASLASPPTTPQPPTGQRPPLPSTSVPSPTALAAAPAFSSSLSSSLRSRRIGSEEAPPALLLRRISSSGNTAYTASSAPNTDSRSLLSLHRRIHRSVGSHLASISAIDEQSDNLTTQEAAAEHPGDAVNGVDAQTRSTPRPVPARPGAYSSSLASSGQFGSVAGSARSSTSSLLSRFSSSSSVVSSPALFAWMANSSGARSSSVAGIASSGKAARRWSAVRRVGSRASSVAMSPSPDDAAADLPMESDQAVPQHTDDRRRASGDDDEDDDDAGLVMVAPAARGLANPKAAAKAAAVSTDELMMSDDSLTPPAASDTSSDGRAVSRSAAIPLPGRREAAAAAAADVDGLGARSLASSNTAASFRWSWMG
ncbi:hypothetical protein HK405_013981, partial [Cladochytrium tenue]